MLSDPVGITFPGTVQQALLKIAALDIGLLGHFDLPQPPSGIALSVLSQEAAPHGQALIRFDHQGLLPPAPTTVRRHPPSQRLLVNSSRHGLGIPASHDQEGVRHIGSQSCRQHRSVGSPFIGNQHRPGKLLAGRATHYLVDQVDRLRMVVDLLGQHRGGQFVVGKRVQPFLRTQPRVGQHLGQLPSRPRRRLAGAVTLPAHPGLAQVVFGKAQQVLQSQSVLNGQHHHPTG